MTHDAADRERLDELMRESVQGFTAYIGFLPRVLEPGHCEATVEIAPHHLQQDGYVHAGVITTLADHAAGYAAYSVAPPGTRVLSVEFKINLLAPGDGDELVCRAKVLNRNGRRLALLAGVHAGPRARSDASPAARIEAGAPDPGRGVGGVFSTRHRREAHREGAVDDGGGAGS